jgi:hypothetical protein
MNSISFSFRLNTPLTALLCWTSLVVLLGVIPASGQGVPVRLSFKFILDDQGHRPGYGAIFTENQIQGQLDLANWIFSSFGSELQVQSLEILNVPGISSWYLVDPTEYNRDNLRWNAQQDPVTYRWRDDAVNVYINGSPGTPDGTRAISALPPNNNIILVSQGVNCTAIAHEMGHILNLWHTHPPGDDFCSDTLPDNPSWGRNNIASNAFGVAYAQLNDSQRYQVDLTYSNLMSYHVLDSAFRLLSPCQIDRMSTQASKDQDWLLSLSMVYVDSSYGGTANGSLTQPYPTIDQALNAGVPNPALVLESGTYALPSTPLNTPAVFVTRKGPSTIQGTPLASLLPDALEFSTNRVVQEAVVRAQESDLRGDMAGAIAQLEEAEKHATGREKSSLELGLAGRYRRSRQFTQAAAWFNKLAAGADQEGLRQHALREAEAIKKEAERQQKQKSAGDKPQRNGGRQ